MSDLSGSVPAAETDSGYASSSSSAREGQANKPVKFSDDHLAFINRRLAQLEPEDILKWSISTFPSLYQTTAFGLTGLVTIDMLSRLSDAYPNPEAIFIDTLHHFTETLDLVSRVQTRYPSIRLHVYKPDGATSADEFAAKHGNELWKTDDDRYDFLAKVEPTLRSYRDLAVNAVLTGRRRSQGGARGSLPIVEVTDDGLIKINPLANWSFEQVRKYVSQHDVPYNALLDQGYKSVGDWHSTSPVRDGEDERAGRWKGSTKTECGIHNSQSKYAQFLRQQDDQSALQQLDGGALARTAAEPQRAF